jgi:methylmalonyl-CoA/ethylmalonyl-CoA epimerase
MNSNSPGLELGEIGQIGLTVSDLEKAVTFYREVLGIRRLMLSRPEKPDSERFGCALYFKVADIHSTRDELAARGVAFEVEPHRLAKMPDHELWMAFFRDPDSNLLALMCEKRG